MFFLSDNGACAEDIPEDVTIDELVEIYRGRRDTMLAALREHFPANGARPNAPSNDRACARTRLRQWNRQRH